MARALTCTSCSAPLPDPDGRDFLQCGHCGRVHDLRGAARAPADAPSVQVEVGNAGCVVALATGATALVGLVVSLWLVAVDGGGQGPAPDLGQVIQGAVGAVSPKRLLWDDVGGAPLVLTAPTELVVGRVREFPEDHLFLAGFGPDAKERWRVGPIGTYMEGYNSSYFAEAGGRVALTDFRGMVHLIDPATGAEVAQAKLTDRAKAVCAMDGRIRVDQVDERSSFVDPASGAVSEAPREPACRWNRRQGPRSEDEDRLPKVAGFKAVQAWPVSDGVLAAGHKHPGTPTPMAVRVRGRDVAWSERIPSVDPATVRDHGGDFDADARGVAASYGVGTEDWHVALLDAESGARVWDVTLRRIFAVDNADQVVLTPTRVLVVRTSSLDVLDRADGRLIGHLGTDTYDDDL